MDDFRYGQRIIVTQNQTAQPIHRATPLTLADFLDPEPDDEFVHGQLHRRDVARLAAALHARHRLSPFLHVLTSPKLIWADGRRPQPAPDITVVGEIDDPYRPRPVLDLVAEPVSIHAVVEVTSPHFAELDLKDKMDLYAAAGIPEYWIVDSGLRPDRSQICYTILGYQLSDRTYHPIGAGVSGDLASPILRVSFRVVPGGQDYVVGDARTGRLIVATADDLPSASTAGEAKLRADSIAQRLSFDP